MRYERSFGMSKMEKEFVRKGVSGERVKKLALAALFAAGLKGLQFSDSIDMTPKERTIYERI